MKIHLPLALTLFASFYTHSAPPMSCNIGPAHTELAAAKWQVTSCSDGQSLVFATMKERDLKNTLQKRLKNLEQ